jgi:hypothetical protein
MAAGGGTPIAPRKISRIIFETAWAQQSNDPRTYTFTNQTNYSGKQYFFTAPFSAPKATIKAEFVGYPPSSNITVSQTLFIYLDRQSNNTLLIEEGGKVVSSNVTNLPVRINAQLRETVPAQPNMFLVVLNQEGQDVQTIPEEQVSVQADRSFDVLFYLGRGEYIVKLVDDEGRTYASTYMKVVSIDINYQGTDSQKHSIYKFNISMDGTPKMLSDLSVSVDEGKYGTYTLNNVDRVRLDVGQYTGGEYLPAEKHTFKFTSGAFTITVPVDHQRVPTIFEHTLRKAGERVLRPRHP